MRYYQLMQGCCLRMMDHIPDESVDMVLCDLPYGTTQNAWDSIIPLTHLWEHYRRVCKRDAAIVLTAQTPFDKVLGVSNLRALKYEWIWEKPMATGFLNAAKMPLKAHENVLVFCEGKATYNPQMVAGKPYIIKRGRLSSNYGKAKDTTTNNEGTRHPRSVVSFQHPDTKLHPTQKPVSLMQYLIKTYSNEGETVLDNTMGSGTTGHACALTKRNFIGIERDMKYFDMSHDRIHEAYSLSGPHTSDVFVDEEPEPPKPKRLIIFKPRMKVA